MIMVLTVLSVRRWCLETMRVTATIDAHSNVNGGAYWVDGVQRNIFTQGRNGVIKQFAIVRKETIRDHSRDQDEDSDDSRTTDDDDSGDDGQEEEQLVTDVEYCDTIKEEEDFGFCTCALTLNECSENSVSQNVSLAVPRSQGRISVYTMGGRLGLTESETNEGRETLRFCPDESLKLGMCMSMTFAEVTQTETRVLVGYEDGSLVLWGTALPSPHVVRCNAPLCRMKMFESSPVLSLDYSASLRVGFVGSAVATLIKFELNEADEDQTKPVLFKASPKTGIEFPSDGVSFVRLRTNPHFPELAVAGGWNARVYAFSLRHLKPLAELELHKKTIRCVDFHEDSGVMAVASDDSHVSLWNLYCQQKQ